MAIKVLDNATIDKIAAGEVVERPSSIVKELVENSIDAGATAITVEIKNGGIDYIRVTDNGCGIDSKELRTAFLRHATSKIASVEDLELIKSLGFRGEALSSISAVSILEVITRTEKELIGTRLTLEGAVETGCDEVGAPVGTTMIVRNIFFNTPVRKKFLKSSMTEASYISDLMEHLALSHPDISIQFSIGSQSRFHTSGNGDLKEVIYRVYGREVSSALIPINIDTKGVRIIGYLGKPEQVRSNRNFEIYFINGRFVKSNLIAKAIEEGFREYLMQHKFPVCFLHIDVNPEFVDVNVHPTKMDVRFSDGPMFFSVLSSAIYDTLKNREMIPGHVLEDQRELKREEKKALEEIRSGKNPEPFERSRIKESNSASIERSLIKENSPEHLEVKHITDEEINLVQKNSAISALREKSLAYKAEAKKKDTEALEEFFFDETEQVVSASDTVKDEKPVDDSNVDDSYVEVLKQEQDINVEQPLKAEQAVKEEKAINENPDIKEPSIVITDFKQTNLFEEKILTKENRSKYRIIGQAFDTYWMVQYENKLFIIDQHAAHEKVNYERLMKNYREKEIVSQNLLPPIIVSLTSKEEAVFNDNSEAFKNLGFEIEHFGGSEYAMRAVPANLYRHSEKELFLSVLDELAEGNSRGSYLAIEEKIASMACKASVKGGDKLSVREVEELIDELLTLENPYNCPHGRPTIIVMSETELEKKFKRIVD